jgi:hypothetical protein
MVITVKLLDTAYPLGAGPWTIAAIQQGGTGMYTLQIEHGIKDFGLWKEAFDRDPVDRKASGVVGHRISQPVGDAHYVVVELDFRERGQAEKLLAELKSKVWNSSSAAPALNGAPQTRILESAG